MAEGDEVLLAPLKAEEAAAEEAAAEEAAAKEKEEAAAAEAKETAAAVAKGYEFARAFAAKEKVLGLC